MNRWFQQKQGILFCCIFQVNFISGDSKPGHAVELMVSFMILAFMSEKAMIMIPMSLDTLER